MRIAIGAGLVLAGTILGFINRSVDSDILAYATMSVSVFGWLNIIFGARGVMSRIDEDRAFCLDEHRIINTCIKIIASRVYGIQDGREQEDAREDGDETEDGEDGTVSSEDIMDCLGETLMTAYDICKMEKTTKDMRLVDKDAPRSEK